MKKSTHSKLKNTGILFELLARQITADVLQGKEQSAATDIMKRYFSPKSCLAKELTLYQTLLNERFDTNNKANYLINTVIKLRNKLDNVLLKKQKYALISEIKKHYPLDAFFRNRIKDYKLYAAAYRLFEGASISKAAEVVRSRFTLLEHLTQKARLVEDSNSAVEGYLKQDQEVRMLAYRLMMDKFNHKYSGLSLKQKALLREYINNVSDLGTLKKFAINEAMWIKKQLSSKIRTVDDRVIQIKLKEVDSMLDRFSKLKTIKESHVLSLLLYHELLKEVKAVQQSNAKKAGHIRD